MRGLPHSLLFIREMSQSIVLNQTLVIPERFPSTIKRPNFLFSLDGFPRGERDPVPAASQQAKYRMRTCATSIVNAYSVLPSVSDLLYCDVQRPPLRKCVVGVIACDA